MVNRGATALPLDVTDREAMGHAMHEVLRLIEQGRPGGMLDMVVVNRWDKAQLWRNLGAGTAEQPAAMGHWLQLRLQQGGGNRDAIGAWVEVDLGGRIERQELTIGGGHASGHLGWMHFGLGNAKDVKVRVQWPNEDWGPWLNVASDAFYVVNREAGVQAWKAQ